MPNSQSNETLTQNYIRAFTQRGGPGPANDIRFAGADEQYLMVGDITDPIRGAINPINVNDPRRRGQFRRIGTTIDAPDITSNTLTFKQRFGGVPWYSFGLDCPLNVYESEGLCNDPSDYDNGWSTMKVLSRGIATERTYQGRTPFDGSDESMAEVNFTWQGGTYTIGGIVLGEVAAVDVTTEVVDIAYGQQITCADCGPANDGTRWIYALQQTAGGSSAVLGKVLYSTDGGATWTASAITGLGVGVLVTAIEVVGSYLVVLVKSENAYYYASLNQYTGAPGSWTKVTTGFVATFTPNDMFVESANRVYFVADGGYIYVSTSLPSGVSVLSAAGSTGNNLLRIRGNGTVLLAVGASGTVLKSSNRGATWVLTSTQLSGTLQACEVTNDLGFWAGNSAGTVSYTRDGGASWSTLALPSPALVGVHDIRFATAEIGYIAATRTGPTAVLFGTINGGRTWVEAGSSRFPAAPTYSRPNRVAFPENGLGISAAYLAVAGLAGSLTDGVIYVGASPIY